MSKNKKQLLTVAVLILLLAAVLAGYIFLSRDKEEKEKEALETDITLSTPKKEDIRKLQYKTESTDMSFSKEGSGWKYDADKDFPVNDKYMSKMVEDMAGLLATKLVTGECTDLKQYGLDAPQLVVRYADSDGSEKTFAVGAESTIASGCYAYLEDTKTVYIVPSDILNDFAYTKEQMMKTPDAPNIIASNVKSYQLLKGSKTVADKRVEEGDSNATVVYSGLANIVYTGGVSYNDDASMIKKCGLDSPRYTVKIEYYETVAGAGGSETGGADASSKTSGGDTDADKNRKYHSLCLFIGNKSKDGSYYVRVDGTRGIYLLSDTAVQSLLDIGEKK